MIIFYKSDLGAAFYVGDGHSVVMTRYSSSRGIMYTAPPTEDDETEVDATAEAEADAAEPTPADD